MRGCFLVLTLLLPRLALAQDFRVKEISITGNHKTKKEVILNEVGFSPGDRVSESRVLDAVKRLRNLGLFSQVTGKIEEGAEGESKRVRFELEERWTTIPVLKFSSGGGVQELTAGVYDPNLFGEFLEAGAQYQRFEDSNSGVLWFKNPRLWGSRSGIDVQAWRTNRIRFKFDQEADDPVVKTGFLQTRNKFFLGYTKELLDNLQGRLFYEYNRDVFSERTTSSDFVDTINSEELAPNSEVHFAGIGIRHGRVDVQSYLLDGSHLDFDLRYGISVTRDLDNFFQSNLAWTYYKTVNRDHTFAQRINGGVTNTELLQYWYYLGGLDSIRGFADNRFSGKYFWLSNTEYRVPVWRRPSFVMQAVGFLDLANATEEIKDFGNLKGASVGAGIRFFLPKVYRFVVRIDYAQTIKRNDDNHIGFGVQQFF